MFRAVRELPDQKRQRPGIISNIEETGGPQGNNLGRVVEQRLDVGKDEPRRHVTHGLEGIGANRGEAAFHEGSKWPTLCSEYCSSDSSSLR